MDKRIPPTLIRISAFLGREVFDVLRQPRLVLTLVVGPFLILLLFGLGFHNQPQALRTLFVVPGKAELTDEIEQYAANLGPQLIFAGVTTDEEEATNKLVRDEVDVVAIVPANAYEKIRNSRQAIVDLFYYEIDPFKIDYVDVFGRIYVNEINRRILRNVIDAGQRNAADIGNSLSRARQNATNFRKALASGNLQAARQYQEQLDQSFNLLAFVLGTSVELLDNVQNTIGEENGATGPLIQMLASIKDDIDFLSRLGANQTSYEAELERVKAVEKELAELETMLKEFDQINAGVLVSPFRHETKNLMPIQVRALDFFTPSVIVLLLQHMAVTFAALSVVREKQVGAIELFQVAPISASETLLGKYLSYFILAALVATVLTILVVFGLTVPMLGLWINYILAVAAIIFTSLSIGFVISLLAKTDSQAVQYTMIVLLASVFFSGAFIGFQMLGKPVQVVSWLLPATYGIHLLQNIMLRGYGGNILLLLGGLTGLGLLLFGVALLLLRHRMARR